MYNLYGNGNYYESFDTEEKAKQGIEEYKEIEQAIFNENTIKYEIVRGNNYV